MFNNFIYLGPYFINTPNPKNKQVCRSLLELKVIFNWITTQDSPNRDAKLDIDAKFGWERPPPVPADPSGILTELCKLQIPTHRARNLIRANDRVTCLSCGRMKRTRLISALQVSIVLTPGDKSVECRNSTLAFFAHGNRVHETATRLESPKRLLAGGTNMQGIVSGTNASVNSTLPKHLPFWRL